MAWTQVANIKGADGADGADGAPGTTSWDGITDKPDTFAPASHSHELSAGATDVTATAAELNVLDGIPGTLTATELGYCDGVTSSIQTQLNSKGTSNLAIGTTTGTAGDGGVLANAVQSGGALGTPSSGTLSSCGSLPISGLTASTSQALGVGSIELGHATDTTIARSAAGIITVEGRKVATVGYSTATSSATPTIDTGLYSIFFASLTALAVDITNMSTNLAGSPVKGDRLWIDITGTAARAIAWGTSYVAGAVALPLTTVTTQRLDVGFIYDGAHWRCMASGSG